MFAWILWGAATAATTCAIVWMAYSVHKAVERYSDSGDGEGIEIPQKEKESEK